MFGSQEDYDLRRFGVAQRIREGGHLLAAVHDLLGDLGWSPDLILANIHERWSLSGAFAMRAMTMGTALIAKQDCTGHFIGLRVGGKRRSDKHPGCEEDS